ncbi:hypothetical protein [Glutamicibacter sp. TV12E]|uniref:hypothetical protein n=1 Tax=Glutamicibacter sp. TV12E TaxID=3446362 RepID=UPI004034E6F1
MEVIEAAASHGFSRFPLVQSDGTAVGYAHVKDVLGADAHARLLPLPGSSIRGLPSFNGTQSMRAALQEMQLSGARLALVRDAGTDQERTPQHPVAVEHRSTARAGRRSHPPWSLLCGTVMGNWRKANSCAKAGG